MSMVTLHISDSQILLDVCSVT